MVREEGPNAVGVLGAVFGDDFLVYLVKFDEVGPTQAEVAKELGSL